MCTGVTVDTEDQGEVRHEGRADEPQETSEGVAPSSGWVGYRRGGQPDGQRQLGAATGGDAIGGQTTNGGGDRRGRRLTGAAAGVGGDRRGL